MTSFKTSVALPMIDQQRCIGCGTCERVCPTGAIGMHHSRPAIDRPDACIFCDRCEAFCPADAIERAFIVRFASERREPSRG